FKIIMEGKLNTIRLIFPKSTPEEAINALKANSWNLDQTIDYLLTTTAVNEIEMKESSAELVEQPTITTTTNTNTAKDEENERILKEFLVLEKQLVEKTNQQIVPQPQSVEPVPMPVEVIELPKPLTAQKIEAAEITPEPQRDLNLLKRIANSLKALEFEIIKKRTYEPEEDLPAPKIEEVPVPVPVPVIKVEEVVEKVVVEEVIEEKDPNNNNNEVDEEEETLSKKLSHDLEHTIEQLESMLSNSYEKSEKVLKTILEEIESWNIKDNVKSLTTSIKNELSAILDSLSSLIAPANPTINEQRDDLERKLQELKAHNARLIEERKIAIEKIQRYEHSKQLAQEHV
ncbi:hypothetical protein SAMD00019534_079010, partial [Acytostelium subglobosum LB1]|uniref:hypothetical protein n=1 Tax=Acytostelium subglobosum LB1 TaxID=1410327 RepID=UPI000644D3CA